MRYSVNNFSHHADTKSFTAEASDLPGSIGREITLVSDFGNEAHFNLLTIEQDDEGDYRCWIFKPIAESVERNPRLAGYSLTIFND